MYSRRLLAALCLLCVVAGPARADDSPVGIWSAAARSNGGLGAQWTFAADGKATHGFGALVDLRYVIEGNRITMTLQDRDGNAQEKPTVDEFSIDGDTLTLNPGTPARVMQRVGKPHARAHPIVGEWTYPHYVGVPAFMRYSRNGSAELAVPFKTFAGTWRRDGDKLVVELQGQKPATFRFRRDDKALELTDEAGKTSRYLKFEY